MGALMHMLNYPSGTVDTSRSRGQEPTSFVGSEFNGLQRGWQNSPNLFPYSEDGRYEGSAEQVWVINCLSGSLACVLLICGDCGMRVECQ